MKYVPLDNIGLPSFKEDGTLSTILAPGNNYPANDLGIPKSNFVSTRQKNIILSGKYSENEATYPLLNPVDANLTPIPNTTFRFIVNLGESKCYTSQALYDDLISAYDERNPWFSIYTVPNIKLDLNFLTQYNLKNKFKVTEVYSETEMIETLDTEEEILSYIDWLVSKAEADIELKSIDELGSWNYVPDGSLGIGVKKTYDSMIKDKNPDPEAIGSDIIKESYSLGLPPVTEVSGFLQPLPPEEIVPKLVDAILSERVPRGKKTYSLFGGGVFGAIATIGVGIGLGALATLIPGVGTAAAIAIGGAISGTAVSTNAIAKIQQALGKFKGSWLEYILARSSDRGLFENKNKVFNREKTADTQEWNTLLLAAKGQMGVTKYNETHVKDALKIIFSQIGGDVKANDLSYPIKVGGTTKRMSVVPTSYNKVNIILR